MFDKPYEPTVEDLREMLCVRAIRDFLEDKKVLREFLRDNPEYLEELKEFMRSV